MDFTAQHSTARLNQVKMMMMDQGDPDHVLYITLLHVSACGVIPTLML